MNPELLAYLNLSLLSLIFAGIIVSIFRFHTKVVIEQDSFESQPAILVQQPKLEAEIAQLTVAIDQLVSKPTQVIEVSAPPIVELKKKEAILALSDPDRFEIIPLKKKAGEFTIYALIDNGLDSYYLFLQHADRSLIGIGYVES